MYIVVDYLKCTGLGMCEAEVPELFELDPDGILRVLCDRPSPGRLAAARPSGVGLGDMSFPSGRSRGRTGRQARHRTAGALREPRAGVEKDTAPRAKGRGRTTCLLLGSTNTS